MYASPQRIILAIVFVTLAVCTPVTFAVAQTCLHNGDVNRDELITPEDALLTLQQFLGVLTPPLDACQQTVADANQDGSLTPKDALCIFQTFLGQPSCLVRTISLTPIVTGLEQPVFITHAGDARLFIVERPGRIRILHQGTLLAAPFLDITSSVSLAGEGGLLSIAFHPNYGIPEAPGDGFLWVNYTNTQGDTVIARYTVSPDDSNRADPASARILLTIEQPFTNHNGGQIHFGPVAGLEQKRYLYIGMGDGGSGGDPLNNAQNDGTLHGKLLRIDPSIAAMPDPPAYVIPPDNPNIAAGIPLGAIWAKGLRNPWRFSFDAQSGDLYMADVGQNLWEEVHVTPMGTPAGQNYGWRIMEGPDCFDPPSACDMQGLELPVFTYAHSSTPFRCAIIGGYVYRGRRFPTLHGTYIYADLCSGEIFGLDELSPGNWRNTLLHVSDAGPLTLGTDVNQELYLGGGDGSVYQLVVP